MSNCEDCARLAAELAKDKCAEHGGTADEPDCIYCRYEGACCDLNDLRAELAAVKAERDALRRYASHRALCEASTPVEYRTETGNYDCACGLSELLEGKE